MRYDLALPEHFNKPLNYVLILRNNSDEIQKLHLQSQLYSKQSLFSMEIKLQSLSTGYFQDS